MSTKSIYESILKTISEIRNTERDFRLLDVVKECIMQSIFD